MYKTTNKIKSNWASQVINSLLEDNILNSSKIKVSLKNNGFYIQNTITLFSAFIALNTEENLIQIYKGDHFTISSKSGDIDISIIPITFKIESTREAIDNISKYLEPTDFSVVEKLGFLK